jgi:monomeric isocitrate dehydrogenase
MNEKEAYVELLQLSDNVKGYLRRLHDHDQLTVRDTKAFYSAARALLFAAMPLYLASNFGGDDADTALVNGFNDMAKVVAEDTKRLIAQLNAIDAEGMEGGTDA